MASSRSPEPRNTKGGSFSGNFGISKFVAIRSLSQSLRTGMKFLRMKFWGVSSAESSSWLFPVFGCLQDASLIKLSTRYEGYGWDAIAKHMPTWRTAWRCFSRYQRCLNNSILKVWSPSLFSQFALGMNHHELQFITFNSVFRS